MIEISKDVQNSVAQSYDNNDFVELPFNAPLFWWKRGGDMTGDDVAKHGGWICNQENFIKMAPYENGEMILPKRMDEVVFSSSYSGGTYSTYCTRSMPVAPFAQRFRWTYRTTLDGEKDKTDKGRGHLQVLAIAAIVDDAKKYQYWSPVILSAKGLSAKSLQDCLKAFDSATMLLRGKELKGIPANFFWQHLGSFGKEMVKKTVGSGNQSNFITPIQVYMPETVDMEFLEKVFVGNEIATTMGELAKMSAEWLDEWKSSKTDTDFDEVDENIPASDNEVQDYAPF